MMTEKLEFNRDAECEGACCPTGVRCRQSAWHGRCRSFSNCRAVGMVYRLPRKPFWLRIAAIEKGSEWAVTKEWYRLVDFITDEIEADHRFWTVQFGGVRLNVNLGAVLGCCDAPSEEEMRRNPTGYPTYILMLVQIPGNSKRKTSVWYWETVTQPLQHYVLCTPNSIQIFCGQFRFIHWFFPVRKASGANDEGVV